MYDCIIIGAGIAGLSCAYQIVSQNPYARILILEKGKDLNKRNCPASMDNPCIKCKSCSIMNGVAGCGAFSDGKFILSDSYGGWLGNEIGHEKAQKYILQVNDMIVRFGDTSKVYKPNDDLSLLCLQHDITMQQSMLKHIGTENNLRIMTNLVNYLREHGVEIYTNYEVGCIRNNTYSDSLYIYSYDSSDKLECKKCVIATGRSGSDFVNRYCSENNIPVENNQVDVGVRVELPREIWKHFEEKIYEPKLLYRTGAYKDICRMFCFNGGGIVVNENTNGIITVNGHSYANEDDKTDNSNFAILSTINFTEPFNTPTDYVRHISKLANMIGAGGTIVQRFGDLISGQRTTEHRLAQSTVSPTLKCIAGDLSLVLPKRQLDNIIEMIYKLNEVAPGTSNHDTLLYGIEAKYYSSKPAHDKNFMVSNNVYCIGDGSGVTRSLSQAGAQGIYVGERIA